MDKEFLSQIDQIDDLIASTETLDNEVLICECFCVNVGDIRLACHDQQIVDVKALQDSFSLGLGCQGCLKKIDSWVNKIF
jgi:NAD(P)H-nitrite reductase large subunit